MTSSPQRIAWIGVPMEQLTVEVIQLDLDEGRCGDPTRCAFALAAVRALDRVVGDVSVGTFTAKDRVSHKTYSLTGNPRGWPSGGWRELPADCAARFVDRFDKDRTLVDPGTFQIVELLPDLEEEN